MTALALSIPPIANYQYTGTTAVVRVYYSQTFIDSAGTEVIGDPTGQGGFYLLINCTVAAGVLTIPTVNLTTTDNPLPPASTTCTVTAVLYDPTNQTRRETLFENFTLPLLLAPSCNLGQLTIYNRAVALLNPVRQYLDRDEVLALINVATGTLNDASVATKGRTKVSYPPLSASNPIAVGDNDPRIIDTSSFGNDLAATLAAYPSGRWLINISGPTNVTDNLTVSVRFILRFNGGGILNITTGKTLTIQGAIEAPPVRIFFGGTVDFTGNQLVTDYWIDWWGAAGDGVADDSVLVNAAFTAWPAHGTTLHLGANKAYKGTFVCQQKFQGTVMGSRSQDGWSSVNLSSSFISGVGANGTVLTCKNVYATTFRGFVVRGDANSIHGIDLTHDQGANPVPLTSQCVFQSLYIYPNSSRTDWIGLNVDNVSGQNNEQHQFNDCKWDSNSGVFPNQFGTGLRLGHINVKQVRITRCTFGNMGVGIQANSGADFRAHDCVFENLAIMVSGSVGAVSAVDGSDSESCTQVWSGGSAYGSMSFTNNRFEDLRGGQANGSFTSSAPIFELVGHCALTIEDNEIASWNGGGAGFTSAFMSGNTATTLSFLANAVQDGAGNPMDASSLQRSFMGFGLVNFLTGNRTQQLSMNLAGGQSTINSGSAWPQFAAQTSTGLVRKTTGIHWDGDTFGLFNNQITVLTDDIVLGDCAQLDVQGLARPTTPGHTYVGANDFAQPLIIMILARDALGNRTPLSGFANDNGASLSANTTLSGSNYVHFFWPTVPNATDYLLVQYSAATYRVIATVSQVAGNVQTYDLIANPAGAFTYALPTVNEMAKIRTNAGEVSPVVLVSTATYTCKPSDRVIVIDSNANNVNITLPAFNASVGQTIEFIVGRKGANTITLTASGTGIAGAGTYAALTADHKSVTLRNAGAQAWGSQWEIIGSN